MLEIAAKVCAIVLVTLLISKQCCSLEVYYKNEVNNELLIHEGPVPKSNEAKEGLLEEPPQPSETLRYDLLSLFYGGKFRQNENGVHNNVLSNEPISDETQNNVRDNEVNDTDESISDENQEGEIAGKRRVIRQAYNGHQQIYPKLPTNSPYNPNLTYPNYNTNQNQQWLPPRNNSQGYSSNGSFNSYPSNPSYGTSPYSQYNSNYSNYNNAGQYPTPTPYSGYRPPNNTFNNSGAGRPFQNGQFHNTYSSNYSNYNNAGQYPTPTPYSGYRPPNNTFYNPGAGKPFQHGQFNNTYSSQRPPYSISTPRNTLPVIYHPPVNNYNTTFGSGNRYNQSSGPYPRPQNGQNTQYFKPTNPYGQRNSTYPLNVPTQRPIYNPTNNYPGNNSFMPGQNPYNSNNATPWPGYGNAAGGIPTSPYGQNPPSFNPYLGTQNPPNNQYPGNQIPGNFQGGDTFNLAHGFNPSIPSRPPYNSGPGQTQLSYPYANGGTTQDPTKVNPGYFSYPH